MDELEPSDIDTSQRTLSQQIYEGLIELHDEYLDFGVPIWQGGATFKDSMLDDHKVNVVPLVDDNTDTVSTILFIATTQDRFNAFFVPKSEAIQENMDSLESGLGDNIYSINNGEILDLFSNFECLLYCRSDSIETRDPGPKCPKWNDKSRRGRFRRGNGGGNGSNDPNDFTVYVWWGNGRSLYSYANSGSIYSGGGGSNNSPVYFAGQYFVKMENCGGLGDPGDTGPHSGNGQPDSAFCYAWFDLQECLPEIGNDWHIIDWYQWYDEAFDNMAWEGMQEFGCTNRLPGEAKEVAIRWFRDHAVIQSLSWADFNTTLSALQRLHQNGVDINDDNISCLLNQSEAGDLLDDYVISEINGPEEEEIVIFANAAVNLLCVDPEVKMARVIELDTLIQSNPNALIQDCIEENSEYDLDFWSDLASFVPNQSVLDVLEETEGEWDIQLIEDGSSARVNLDYFSVNITQLPDIDHDGTSDTAWELYNYIRRQISDFTYPWSVFIPISSIDEQKWNSTDPLTALLSIEIQPPFDDGSVITSHTEYCCWIFTTLDAPWNGELSNFADDNQHPVCGNRQFGFAQESNGSWTFYTKAADRIRSPLVGSVGSIAYTLADGLWNNFQNEIVEFINNPAQNGAATKIPAIKYRPKWNKVRAALKSSEPLTLISCD